MTFMDDAELERLYDRFATGLFRYFLSFTKCERRMPATYCRITS